MEIIMGVGKSDRVATRSIEKRAYELWRQRGCPDGSSQEDWLVAERELNQALPAPARRTRPRSLSVQRVNGALTSLLAALVPHDLSARG